MYISLNPRQLKFGLVETMLCGTRCTFISLYQTKLYLDALLCTSALRLARVCHVSLHHFSFGYTDRKYVTDFLYLVLHLACYFQLFSSVLVSVLRTSINVLSKSKSKNYVTWIANLTKLFLSVHTIQNEILSFRSLRQAAGGRVALKGAILGVNRLLMLKVHQMRSSVKCGEIVWPSMYCCVLCYGPLKLRWKRSKLWLKFAQACHVFEGYYG